MREVVSAGGIVVDADQRTLLVIRDDGFLGFLKGHVEKGETREEAALREFREESGHNATILDYIGATTRAAIEYKTGEEVNKTVHMYWMKLGESTGITPECNTGWFTLEEFEKRAHHPEDYELAAAFLGQLALVDVAPGEYG